MNFKKTIFTALIIGFIGNVYAGDNFLDTSAGRAAVVAAGVTAFGGAARYAYSRLSDSGKKKTKRILKDLAPAGMAFVGGAAALTWWYSKKDMTTSQAFGKAVKQAGLETLIGYPLMQLNVVVHEFGHALAAKYLTGSPVSIRLGNAEETELTIEDKEKGFRGHYIVYSEPLFHTENIRVHSLNPVFEGAAAVHFMAKKDRWTPAQDIMISAAGPAAGFAAGLLSYGLLRPQFVVSPMLWVTTILPMVGNICQLIPDGDSDGMRIYKQVAALQAAGRNSPK